MMLDVLFDGLFISNVPGGRAGVRFFLFCEKPEVVVVIVLLAVAVGVVWIVSVLFEVI